MHCKCESHHSPSGLSASCGGGGGQGVESGSRCSAIFGKESDISINIDTGRGGRGVGDPTLTKGLVGCLWRLAWEILGLRLASVDFLFLSS